MMKIITMKIYLLVYNWHGALGFEGIIYRNCLACCQGGRTRKNDGKCRNILEGTKNNDNELQKSVGSLYFRQ
jgi:hypothetical protein